MSKGIDPSVPPPPSAEPGEASMESALKPLLWFGVALMLIVGVGYCTG